MKLTSRERLRRAYEHEEMDRPAIYSRSGFPQGDATYDALKAYLAEHAELKDAWGVETTPYPVTQYVEPYSETFERHVSVLHTPKGDLRATRLESLTGQAGLHETFYINNRDDAEKYLSLPLPEIVGDVSAFFEKDRRMGDRGIVEVSLGHNPAGVVASLCGSENFAMMSITDRDILHALCEREMGIQLAKVDFALAQGTGLYFRSAGQEFLVPPLHGPADFWDFNVKYDRPIFDRIHDAGGRVHVHSHGSIAKMLDGFLAVGGGRVAPLRGAADGRYHPAGGAAGYRPADDHGREYPDQPPVRSDAGGDS